MTYKEFMTTVECRTMSYKGFNTDIEFSEEDNLCYGALLDENSVLLSDLVVWESDDLEGCEKSFHEMVDYYLEFRRAIDSEDD